VKREQVGIFFDRDATISTEIDFLQKPEEPELIPKTAQAIREANGLGIKVFIITNQSGIARGFLTEGDLSAVHARLRTLLTRQNAGCTSFLVLTGYGKTERSECKHSDGVNHVADNAYDAWLQIKKMVKPQNVSSRPSSTGR
jgi:HAD superfamily hydrolase (TIGR01662 family)